MKTLWKLIQAHRPVFYIYGAAWLVLWAAIIATWMYDAQGKSMGMTNGLFMTYLLLPIVTGYIFGYFAARLPGGLGYGSLSGFLCGLGNFLAILLWSAYIIAAGKADPMPGSTFWSNVLEALEMGVVFCLSGTVFGALGGLAGSYMGGLLQKKPSA